MLYAAELALMAAAYVVTALLSLRFASINPSATPIWPPTGVALALVLLRGYRIWPAILAGAVTANALTAGTLATSLAIGAGNTLEALAGAWLLNLWAGGVNAFRTPWGVGKFAVIIGAVSTPISASIGVLALALAGFAGWSGFAGVWTTWWLGDLAGAVVVTPALVLWARHPPRFSKPFGRVSESSLVQILALAVGLVAYGPFPRPDGGAALTFLAVMPLLWAALRCSERDTASVTVILSVFAVWGAVDGTGPFVQPTLNGSFLLLVAFMVSIAVPSLALSAGMAERSRALAASEENHRLLVESVRDYAIFMLDAGGRVATWNAGAAQIYGYDAREIIGEHVRRLHTGEDLAPDDAASVLARAAETERLELEGLRLRRDGRRFWASVVVNAIRDERGRLVGFAKVTRDISERRQAEDALDRTREQLLQSQKLEALGQLTGGIAHDFNNLLMIIGGQAELLGRRLADEGQLKAVEAIRAATGRGASLTRQLLSFARRQTLTPDVIDLPERLAAMRGMLQSSLGEAVELVLDLDPEVWPIEVDVTELELALINLAVNARDAMADGGRLDITAYNLSRTEGGDQAGPAGEFVAISVADTGPGMSPGVLAKAFDPFFTTKPLGKGTGLGLSQVHGFATQSGGFATAENAPGQGARITLLLPRAKGAPVAPTDAGGTARRADACGAVLVVEDNLEVAEVTSALLRGLGYDVVHDSNAADALRRLDAGERFDLVFSDIVMPGALNGLALAQAIRTRHPNIKVVLATGFSDTPQPASGFQILRKPFDAETLAAALHEVLTDVTGARNV